MTTAHTEALRRLIALGWVTYQRQLGWHWFQHVSGRESAPQADYAAAIAAAEGETLDG